MKRKALGLIAAALLGIGSAQAAPIQWNVNGNWYEFIPGQFTWQQALTDAQSRTHLGEQGYLANLTSADENRFASVTVAGSTLAWIGGTDEAVEGTWRWADGPEAGQALAFFNWNGGEPNNCCGGEDYLQTNWAVPAGWNDHGGPANAGQVNGYIVEFAGRLAVPEPASLALLGLGLVGLAFSRRPR